MSGSKIVVPKVDLDLPNFNNGIWLFPEQMEVGVGFIYVIRDKYMKKFYLGKKNYKVGGKGVNKGKITNWRTYMSSSKLLQELIEERPWEEFDFICLEQYKTKGTLSYAETWSLCLVEAPTTDMWYNKRIEAVRWNVSEPITDRHKDRLHKAIALEEFDE